MNDLISVIIPVYNRKYCLQKCVESALSQKGVNTEIILVDDGSTDNSAAICDEYASKYENVKAVHKENGGISSARNTGLDVATGDYIFFLDSDDTMTEGALKSLLDSIKTNNVDYVIGNAIREREDGTVADKELIPPQYLNSVVDSKTVLNLSCDSKYHFLFVVLWAKLFKKDLWNELRFPPVPIGEDEYVLPDLLKDNTKVYISDFTVYRQTLSKTSLIRAGAFSSRKFYGPITKLRVARELTERGIYDIAVKKLTISAGEIVAITKRIVNRSDMPTIKSIYKDASDIGKVLLKYMDVKKKHKYLAFRLGYPFFYRLQMFKKK